MHASKAHVIGVMNYWLKWITPEHHLFVASTLKMIWIFESFNLALDLGAKEYIYAAF